MDRIERIKAYKEKQDAIAVAKAKKERDEYECLLHEVQALGTRIKAMLQTATACIQNGIEIDARGRYRDHFLDEWEKGSFFTNGMTHKVGFYKGANADKVDLIGIRAGGACGALDFVTDGDEVRSIHESSRALSDPTILHMRRFIKEFPAFESAFYQYVDKIVGSDI